MRILGLLTLVAMLLASCVDTTVEAPSEPVKDGVFIHISEGYEDAHRALMPLKMATIMADDKDVLIYMDIHAVNLLVKGAEDLTHDGFESAQTYLKQLLDMGVGIYACPTCLQVASFGAEDLMEGIQTAQKEKFFNFTEGRILTLDY
jgi:predicted peroxiredoxin